MGFMLKEAKASVKSCMAVNYAIENDIAKDTIIECMAQILIDSGAEAPNTARQLAAKYYDKPRRDKLMADLISNVIMRVYV